MAICVPRSSGDPDKQQSCGLSEGYEGQTLFLEGDVIEVASKAIWRMKILFHGNVRNVFLFHTGTKPWPFLIFLQKMAVWNVSVAWSSGMWETRVDSRLCSAWFIAEFFIPDHSEARKAGIWTSLGLPHPRLSSVFLSTFLMKIHWNSWYSSVKCFNFDKIPFCALLEAGILFGCKIIKKAQPTKVYFKEKFLTFRIFM